MKQTYTCPECQDDIECDENAKACTCPSCKTEYRIDHDAEQIEGVWKDRTTLTPVNKCTECGTEIPNDIWKDPMVREALKDGRSADGIMVIACPKCNRYGYYNEGSHFSCRFCNETFHITDSDEFEPVTLADTITETTEGYHNETMPHN